jgi:hypothetical protein
MPYRFARSLPLHASVLALIAGLASAPALADDAPPFSDLPSFLLERMNRSATLDDYVSNLVREAKRGDLDGNGLDRQDIDAARQMEAAQYRASLVTQVAMYDLDGNGDVTRDEATRAASFQMRLQGYDDSNQAARQKRIGQQVDRVMALDGNGDGTVTLQEAMQAERPDSYHRDRYAQYEPLLALDPNEDGRLTMEELDQVARAAFQEADYDHDGALSPSELKLLEPARQFQRQLQAAMPCDLPKPDTNDLVVVLSTWNGGLQPNVTVAGQDGTTQLSQVAIEPGDRPLYLVLTAYYPNIWQLSGATDRLTRVIVVRSSLRTDKQPDLVGAGVIGVGADKVTFLPPRSCGTAFEKADSKEGKAMAYLLARVTGRGADAMLAVHAAKSIAVPSGTAATEVADKDLVIVPGGGNDVVIIGQNSNTKIIQSKGDLSLAAQEDWLAPVAGLVTLDPSQVVAPGKVEPYQVLPNQYGLRQLVAEGKLERTEQGYRIVQPIARFPNGLAGAHRVIFLLPEGTPMPAGDAGHSEIILEKKPAQ